MSQICNKKVAYTLLLTLNFHPATHCTDPIPTDVTSTTQGLYRTPGKKRFRRKSTLGQIQTTKKGNQTIAKKISPALLSIAFLFVIYTKHARQESIKVMLKKGVKVKIGEKGEEQETLRLVFKVTLQKNNIPDNNTLKNLHYYLSVSEDSHVKADLSIKAVGMLKQGGGLVDEFEVTVVKANEDNAKEPQSHDNKATPTPHNKSKTNDSDPKTKECSILKLKIRIGQKNNITKTFETEVDLSGQTDKIIEKADCPEYKALERETCIDLESIVGKIKQLGELNENNREFSYVLSTCCGYKYYSLQEINRYLQEQDPNNPTCPSCLKDLKYQSYAIDAIELKEELTKEGKFNTEEDSSPRFDTY